MAKVNRAKAWEEGYRAASNGAAKDTCPYWWNSGEATSWRCGWDRRMWEVRRRIVSEGRVGRGRTFSSSEAREAYYTAHPEERPF